MKAVVVSLVVVFFLTVTAAVGADVAMVLGGVQVGVGVEWLVGLLLGGYNWRYLGGGPGRLRRLELGQLCRAHSDLVRGLVERSQVFFGAHTTERDRTLPPHVTGHCREGTTQIIH